MEVLKIDTEGVGQTRCDTSMERNMIMNEEDRTNWSNEVPLPNEIWTLILERVKRNDDLLACRRVNRQWYSITTAICQRRFLQLNFSKVLDDLDNVLMCFYFTFENCNNFPWSSCKLHLSPSATPVNLLSPVQIRNFIRHFGSHIHELTLSGRNNRGLTFILKSIANLTYLDMSSMDIKQPIIIQEPFTTRLEKLRGLIASISNHHDFHLFQLLLNRPEVKLRSLQLAISPYEWRSGNGEILTTLIAGIPILHLELRRFVLELFTQLIRNKVQVHQLKICLNISPPCAIFCSNVEAFLKNTAESLQKLILDDAPFGHEVGNARLTIPTLPKLTHLVLHDGQGRESKLHSFVTPFASGQFPRLAKVDACVNGNSEEPPMSLFDLGTFDTVTQLGLSDMDYERRDSLELDWNWIFPNVKKLEVQCNGGGLALILDKFKRLERLFVAIPWPLDQPEEDVSTVLSGRIRRQFGTSKQWYHLCDSLLTLTSLKEFKLRVGYEHTMSDAFVDSHLLQIQPLDTLYLEGVVISEESKEKLHRYHRKAAFQSIYKRYRNGNGPSKYQKLR